jgi:indole-3-glycerol phosphate synthase
MVSVVVAVLAISSATQRSNGTDFTHNSVTSSSTMSMAGQLNSPSKGCLMADRRTDVVVKAQQGAAELLVVLHDNPYFRSDAFVDELC